MRAIAENPHAAAFSASTSTASVATFAISSALGAVAGVLFALNVNAAQLGMGLSGRAQGTRGDHRRRHGITARRPRSAAWHSAWPRCSRSTTSEVSWRDMVAFGLLFAILLLRPRACSAPAHGEV